jgi:hypothetical protein
LGGIEREHTARAERAGMSGTVRIRWSGVVLALLSGGFEWRPGLATEFGPGLRIGLERGLATGVELALAAGPGSGLELTPKAPSAASLPV